MIIYHKGRGLLNRVINQLPIELHIPGYQYCGPGTRLKQRLARGDPGINKLDQACKEHDIAYSKNRDVRARNIADSILANKAWDRVRAIDSDIGEKAAVFAVSNAMKLKSKFGMGVRKKKVKFASIVKAAKKSMSKNKKSRIVIKSALDCALAAVKKAGGKSKIIVPRILPVSEKVGGYLPFLIPLFAGLSATGALAGGAAGIAKAVNDASAAKKQLEENKRHNKTMETIALGKGLYLKPYKTGMGLHLKPYTGLGVKKKSSK